MRKEYILLLLILFAVVLSVFGPIIHDYRHYVIHWNHTFDGGDPYSYLSNTYGIAYVAFSIFSFISFPVPKVIFVLTYFWAGYKLWLLFFKQKNPNLENVIFIVLFFNPLFWIFGVKYGSNDAFLAGITILAILTYTKKQYIASGVLFATGIAFKFTPLFILPFFILSNRKINYKLGISFLSTILLLYGSAYIMWGTNFIQPFLYGAEREACILSIFRFIGGTFQPLGVFNITNLDFLSTYIIVFICIIIFIFYYIQKTETLFTAFFTLSNVLLFYKVGHPQFFFTLLLFFTFIVYNYKDTLLTDKFFIYTSVIFWSALFLTVLFYDQTQLLNEYAIVREWIGAPFFLIHLSFNISIIRHQIKFKLTLNN